MQRVANCIYIKNNQILLLQKPRRGWWAIPGGKVEPEETVKQAVIREYWEETGITIKNPVLTGIYTFLMRNGDQNEIREWMMFTFFANEGEGEAKEETLEGKLQWHPIEKVKHLPMAEGDHSIIRQALFGKDVLFGTFEYTEDFRLLSYKTDR